MHRDERDLQHSDVCSLFSFSQRISKYKWQWGLISLESEGDSLERLLMELLIAILLGNFRFSHFREFLCFNFLSPRKQRKFSFITLCAYWGKKTAFYSGCSQLACVDRIAAVIPNGEMAPSL